MPSLERELQGRIDALVAADVTLDAAVIRGLVREFGGGEGRSQIAEGNRILAGELGVSVRTVQRWQKDAGSGEARDVNRSTAGLRISVKALADAQQRAANVQRLRDDGLTVDLCECWVQVSNEQRSRFRRVRQVDDNAPLHLDGATMGLVLDEIDAGHTATAADIFGAGMLGPYGISQAAEITDVENLTMRY